MKMKINSFGESFILRTEDDESGVISFKGTIYKINAIASLMIQKYEKNRSIIITCEEISGKYGVDKKTILEDFKELSHQLHSVGI